MPDKDFDKLPKAMQAFIQVLAIVVTIVIIFLFLHHAKIWSMEAEARKVCGSSKCSDVKIGDRWFCDVCDDCKEYGEVHINNGTGCEVYELKGINQGD